MKHKALLSVLVMAVALVWVLPAIGQDDITQLAPAAFENPQRPPAVFVHDAHNEKAEIMDCLPCHHEGMEEDGTFIESMDFLPCSDCHMTDDPDLPLEMAYHRMCMGCHEDQSNGPVTCGECHVIK